ncbi:MAG: hypothetical protein N2C13_05925 [Chloroflexota bacterium]
MKLRTGLIIVLTSIFSSACSNLPPNTNNLSTNTAVVSQAPIATGEDIPATASMTRTPTATLTPAGTSVVASPNPGETLTPTETPASLVDPDGVRPEGEIQIYVPGELSRLISPFRFVANVEPSPNHTVLIELLGEDGRLLTRKYPLAFPPRGFSRTNAVTEINFEIDGLAEAGRLVVSVEDEYGRVHALASVNVILLSTGKTQMNPYIDRLENIIVQQPSANVMVQGTSLIVTGLARTQSENLLLIELIDREGKVITFGFAAVVTAEGEDYGFFALELSYAVEDPIWVMIRVQENGVRIPGPIHISTIEMVISP